MSRPLCTKYTTRMRKEIHVLSFPCVTSKTIWRNFRLDFVSGVYTKRQDVKLNSRWNCSLNTCLSWHSNWPYIVLSFGTSACHDTQIDLTSCYLSEHMLVMTLKLTLYRVIFRNICLSWHSNWPYIVLSFGTSACHDTQTDLTSCYLSEHLLVMTLKLTLHRIIFRNICLSWHSNWPYIVLSFEVRWYQIYFSIHHLLLRNPTTHQLVHKSPKNEHNPVHPSIVDLTTTV
jgi:hypothetical protein